MAKVRIYLGTLNNPKVDPEEFLSLWHTKANARYVCGQLEKAEEGTPHIQYYLNFKEPKRIVWLKKHCPLSHFEPVKRDNGASPYCMKEETRIAGPWEFGIKPVKLDSKIDWQGVFEKAKAGELDAIPA